MSAMNKWLGAVLVLAFLAASAANGEATAGEAPRADPQEPQRLDYWTCAMHPQIRSARPGKCPMCGMELILIPAPEKPLSIPEGKLGEFCREYVARKMEEIDLLDSAETDLAISSYAAIEGKDAVARLKAVLDGSNLAAVGAAAYQLGEFGERSAVPDLKKALDRVPATLERVFTCSVHREIRMPKPGACPICARKLVGKLDVSVLGARLGIAEALAVLGDPEGIAELSRLAKTKYHIYVFGALASKKSEKALDILNRAAESDEPVDRAYAVAALLRLGEKKRLAQVIRMTESPDLAVRMPALSALAEAADPAAAEALEKAFAAAPDDGVVEKLVAAEGLARLGKKKYSDFIVESARRAADGDVGAVQMLGTIGGREQLPLLKEIVEKRPLTRPFAVAAVLQILDRADRHGESPTGRPAAGPPDPK